MEHHPFLPHNGTESSRIAARREWVFVCLAGLFVTNAITAELISNKLISVWGFTTIIGILPWPVVFIITDLMNEFYGKAAVNRLSWITAGLIAYCFIIVLIALKVPAAPGLSTDEQYNAVFGQAPWIIAGSIAAFLFSQLLDASIFAWLKRKTGNKMIWLRSTGSTLISQLFDSFIVLYIGFVLPGKMSLAQMGEIGPRNYVLKVLIAVALTPVIYAGHIAVRKYLAISPK
jgi:queuosine precursor transporter